MAKKKKDIVIEKQFEESIPAPVEVPAEAPAEAPAEDVDNVLNGQFNNVEPIRRHIRRL